MTEAEIGSLFDDPECPWGVATFDKDKRPVYVGELVEIAKRRFGATNPEPALDEHIERIGGERVHPVDLDHLTRRAFRKLLGRTNPPGKDV